MDGTHNSTQGSPEQHGAVVVDALSAALDGMRALRLAVETTAAQDRRLALEELTANHQKALQWVTQSAVP